MKSICLSHKRLLDYALGQLRRVMFRWRVRPERVIADTTYGTIDNIRALEGEEGIRAYVPLPDWEHQRPYYGPRSSRTTLKMISISVPKARRCAPSAAPSSKNGCSTGQHQRPATPVP